MNKIKNLVGMFIKQLVKTFIYFYIVQAIILMFFPKIVPTESMTNTIQVYDVVQTKPGINPQRGEIWGFYYKPFTYYFKRVIGLPGDTIEIRAGDIYINGEYLEEDYIDYPIYENLEPIELGKNEYFVLGDHRDGSFDSRAFGPVKKWRFRYKYVRTITNISELVEKTSGMFERLFSGFN